MPDPNNYDLEEVMNIWDTVDARCLTDSPNAGEVRDLAKKNNRSGRDFSADVWTGIRDTLARTGELFGIRHGRRSVGVSKSLADHFDDLINEKSASLGISRKAMLDRLQKGDASLLGYVIATPIGAAMFDQLYGGDSSFRTEEDL